MSSRCGFTLVELIITLFIISVALLGTVFAFTKTTSLVQEAKDIAVVDEYIASEMEDVRGTDYNDITEPETTVTVWLGPPISASTQVSVKIVSASSSFTSSAYPGKNNTRSITFYVYEKGINYRQ